VLFPRKTQGKGVRERRKRFSEKIGRFLFELQSQNLRFVISMKKFLLFHLLQDMVLERKGEKKRPLISWDGLNMLTKSDSQGSV
jgi:hypothetical protein